MTIPATVTGALKVQFAVAGGPWRDLGHAHDLGALLRTRRFAFGPGQGLVARYLRLVKVGAHDWGTSVVQVGDVQVLQEQEADAGDLPLCRLWNFNYDDAEQRYTLVATAGNLEVYKAGARQASIPLPHTEAQIPAITRAQALDTLIAFHADVPPIRVMRQGADTEWDSRLVAFDKLPLYDYDGTKAGGDNDVQTIVLTGFVGGDTWQIVLDGEVTSSIGYPPTGSAIRDALEALPSVGEGNVSVTNAVADTTWDVEFIGALAAENIDQMAPQHISSANGIATCYTVQEGKPGGENIISPTRGWPACGTFYQQRLWMGGLKQLPETLLASAAGLYFNFDLATALPNGSIDETMDTDQVTRIQALHPGQHLQIFTSSAEFFVPSEPIAPPVAVKHTTSRGSIAGIPLFAITNADGGSSTAFVGAGAGAIYEFTFSIVSEGYSAPNIARYAGHIVRNIVDAGWRRHRSTDECDLGIMPCADGSATVMVALRDEAVTGFVPWTTQGRFLAAGCELNGDLYVAVSRQLGTGVTKRMLERVDPSRLLDASVAVAAGQQIVDKLEHLEGLVVAAWIDGDDWGDFTVSGGQIDLGRIPQSGGEVGLNFQPDGLTQPGVLQQDPRAGGEMHPRVGDIAFRLGPSANLWTGLVDGRLWRVPMRKKRTVSGEGPGQNPFAGWSKVEAVPGFRDDAQVRFTQLRPGPLQILEIVATVTT